MKRLFPIAILAILLTASCKNSTEKVVEMASETANDMHKTTAVDSVSIIPIEHATLILAH